MSRLFIFGIGGTGSRVIRAFQMLQAANVGDFPADTEIFPIIIDYDVNNGDKKRTMEALQLYDKVNKGIYNRSVYDDKHLDGVDREDVSDVVTDIISVGYRKGNKTVKAVVLK